MMAFAYVLWARATPGAEGPDYANEVPPGLGTIVVAPSVGLNPGGVSFP